MTSVENNLIKQMQKLASAMSAMQGSAGKDKGNQANVSFQDMMQQSGGVSKTNKAVKTDKTDKEAPAETTAEGKLKEKLEEAKSAAVNEETGEAEELKPENLAGNPNAVLVMDLFRPEIVEAAAEQPVEAAVSAIPGEAVQEAAMDLGEQPQMETTVDTSVGAEVSMEQQPKEFGQAMEEAPAQQTAEVKQAAPQQENVQNADAQPVEQSGEQAEKSELPQRQVEVRTENRQETDETGGEAVVQEAPVFHEAEAVPVKVGERYETVDTQQPQMESNLASTIQTAMQAGGERIQIQLTPQNLGSVVIEMTKDASGALQVVLHTSSAKAAGVLSQHLDGLHNALLGYGHEEVRVEVQRSQESQQQDFKQADPDGHGQNQRRQHHQERQESAENGQEFLQKLRLGLFGEDL